MTVLECNVATCAHNDSDKCCKDEILVSGADATKSDATNCNSFDKKGCGCTTETSNPESKVDIHCQAVHCVYNDDNECKSTMIGVVGHSAESKFQTECASFKMR